MENKILYLLFGGLLAFALALIAVAIFVPGNAALYTTLAGILGNFSGAFFMYVRHDKP